MNGIILTSNAYDQMLTKSQLAADGNETGGILLGHDLGMGAGFVVRHCGDPGPDAVRQPARFQRDLAHARMLAERAARLDGSVWIGEWHTHLLEIPAPSMRDLNTYRALLLDQEIQFPRILSIIILCDRDSNWPNPRIFAWSITTNSLRPLPVSVKNPIMPTAEKDHLEQ